MKYKILETFGNNALSKMEEQVKAHIAKGWTPLGAAIPTERDRLLHYTQTLISTLKIAKKSQDNTNTTNPQ